MIQFTKLLNFSCSGTNVLYIWASSIAVVITTHFEGTVLVQSYHLYFTHEWVVKVSVRSVFSLTCPVTKSLLKMMIANGPCLLDMSYGVHSLAVAIEHLCYYYSITTQYNNKNMCESCVFICICLEYNHFASQTVVCYFTECLSDWL